MQRRVAALKHELLRFHVQQKHDADRVRKYERHVQLALTEWVKGAAHDQLCFAMLRPALALARPIRSARSGMRSLARWHEGRPRVRAAPRCCSEHRHARRCAGGSR